MKSCSKCNKMLDYSEFSPSSGGKYLRPECKSCAKKLSKERIELKKIFGSPPKNYTCPICLKNKDQLIGTGGNAGTWVIDHDHQKNKFRGFLCHNCNRGIGIFKDDVNTLYRAINYLDLKFGENSTNAS
jgi:hypothetical protein